MIPSDMVKLTHSSSSISGKTRIDPQQVVRDVYENAKYIRENEN